MRGDITRKQLLCALLITLLISIAFAEKKPNVVIIATGGSIAGKAQSSVEGKYKAAQIPVEELLEAVPEVKNIANIKGIQLCQVSSQNMKGEIWLKLAKKINELFKSEEADAVVVTHGTDTMEETAYFLTLTVKSKKPVVLTGAMRAPTSLSADGPLNIYNAVAVAASSEAKGKGVLVLFNEKIHCAREVTKNNTVNTDSFESPLFGALGYAFYGKTRFYRQSTRKHTFESEFDIKNIQTLPKVKILYGHADFDPQMVAQAIKSGAKGIVYAGVGNGNPNAETEQELAKAVKSNVIVVRSSRVGSGSVTLNAEVDDTKLGFVVADNLNPQKSRILLMLALTKTKDRDAIQKMFFEY